LHPANVFRLSADGVAPGTKYAEVVALEKAKLTLAPHVKLVMPETRISSWSVYQTADVCFTVRGTVGVERAALGKRVVTAGTGPYSGHGFTIDPTSRDDYEQTVRHTAELPRMTEEEHDRALRYAHWL